MNTTVAAGTTIMNIIATAVMTTMRIIAIVVTITTMKMFTITTKPVREKPFFWVRFSFSPVSVCSRSR